ncbi:unnamed protein product [Psylliodes chrysocephalus]|uniref:Uncharacterized protein n=1 Tax=Psylliodes chrysocephalus TaxID=3402493 RepID=A0A9P0D611_9CUCU|nr:unnamed protein product [Psylliodes chrysocephala]
MEGEETDLTENVSENDINNLESEVKIAKQDLKELANYLKTQEQEKSSHEMNIDELKQSTNFYRTQIKRMTKRLIYSKKIFTKFDLALQCYKRLIEIYDETFKLPNDLILNYSSKMKENASKEILHEIEKTKIRIQQNFDLFNDLLSTELSGIKDD